MTAGKACNYLGGEKNWQIAWSVRNILSQEHEHQQAFMYGKEAFKYTKSLSAMLILDIIKSSTA